MKDPFTLEKFEEHLPELGLSGFHLDRGTVRHNFLRLVSTSGRVNEKTAEILNAPETETERTIARFFEHPDAMVFVVDLVEGRFLQINRKVCDVLGYSETELLESSFLDRVHPNDIRRTLVEIEQMTGGRGSKNFKNRHRAADGSYRTLDWTAVVDTESDLCYAMAVEVEE